LRGFKGDLYEGGIRVPFIAHWPGVIPPSVSNTPYAGYDLFATLSEAAGLKKEVSDGISFYSLMRGKQNEQHKFLYFELSEYGGQQAVRMGRWKAVRRNIIKDPDAKWELYDLGADLSEKNNLSEYFPAKIRRAMKIAGGQHTGSPVEKWNFMEF
jgi:arylsulfatase A-like enzyme